MRRTKLQGVVSRRFDPDGERVFLAAYGGLQPEPIALRMYCSRTINHITRQAMADYLNVQWSTIFRWETGIIHSISLDHVRRWARFCAVSPHWILQGGSSKDPELDNFCEDARSVFAQLLEPLPDKLGIPSTPGQLRKKIRSNYLRSLEAGDSV